MSNDNTMSNMLSLAKLFSPSSASNSNIALNEQSWPMFPLDAEIHTESLRVCKSLVPYLSYEKQKNISIFIKFYELMSVIEHFSNSENSDHDPPYFRESETWPKELLYSVKDSLDPSNAYWVDILLKVNDVKDILAAANSEQSSAQATTKPAPVPNPSPSQPTQSKEFIENIAPMLDDNQKKMLEMLSSIMK